ncbi:MAG: AmmeMemoRadiSam system protein A [Christensenella sp.]|nr:AmmeMemoRadiSam system protein A [Christensenella sp.]
MSVRGAFAVPHPPLIIPEIGKGEEKKIQSTVDAYVEVSKEAAALKPDILVIISPHSAMYADYIHISPGLGAKGNFGQFGAPQVKFSVQYDEEFAVALANCAAYEKIPAGFLGEKEPKLDHGTMVPWYFLQKQTGDTPIVRIGISGLSYQMHYRMGMCIQKTAKELKKRVVIVASGDLSHKLTEEGPYGFTPEGPVFDQKIAQAFEMSDFMTLLKMPPDFCDAAAECGLRSFIMMAGAFDGLDVKSKLLSYEGPFGVGYAVASFYPDGSDEERHLLKRFLQEQKEEQKRRKAAEDEYVRLARASLEYYIQTGSFLKIPEEISAALLKQRAGAFVSLKKDGKLRGCIGTVFPMQENVAEEIIRNAVSAGTEDYRFDRVTEEELPELVYSVDILGAPEPVLGMDALDAKKYGVIVSSGARRGLLLPDLAGVDTPEKQVEIALQKAGIGKTETYSMERFEVVRHK